MLCNSSVSHILKFSNLQGSLKSRHYVIHFQCEFQLNIYDQVQRNIVLNLTFFFCIILRQSRLNRPASFRLPQVKSDKLLTLFCAVQSEDSSRVHWRSQRWVRLVTEGGLRWIRYGFINERQDGMAASISYHIVSIRKAGRTRRKKKGNVAEEARKVNQKK